MTAKYLPTFAVITTLSLTAGWSLTQDSDIQGAQFNAAGKVLQPVGYRKWVFVGAPLTPNALNGGEAPFPEFHNVYVEPTAFAAFEATGTWPEGTQIAKELTMVQTDDSTDEETGANAQVSGVGYFQGEFVGLELLIKDNQRFPQEPGGWAFFSFGHGGEPYAETASAFPTDSCNACHADNAETDFVFTQFYPVLRAVMEEN
ncbi:cytochrome P460 family protein [Pseudophaeobacter sp.]|uniref:cytochrome P460 family protein n=1 Tax=Pseudophaeobacter sp. TaxID=1971739 RepID=UPI00405908E3